MTYRRVLVWFLAALCIIPALSCKKNNNKNRVRILILSGQNNHDWNKTTPLLSDIYNKTKLFTVSITEHPDTLNYDSFRKFDVIVSNRNTWPDNNARLSPDWEADFIRYMNEGGATVFIHAGASSFYGWDDYHKIGTGRWGKETSHGKPQKGKVCELSQDHPVTAGIKDFFITDEFWKKTEVHPDAKAIASISWTDDGSGEQFIEKAVFTTLYGKGRSFYTILGHDERAMLNSGFQALLLRGTLWAAKRETDSVIPYELKADDKVNGSILKFNRSDTTISLAKGQNIIWQYNFNNRYGKQYFHPVNAGNSNLTCVSPPDHTWHMGLWFSWKFINGINYWEYLDDHKSEDTGYRSAGTAQINDIKLITDKDFSADISLDIQYQPSGDQAVMSEKCNLHISPPSAGGSYYIDFDHTFSPVSGEVVLDRTPIAGEPAGQSWGGYSGLSVRFSQDYTSASIISPDSANNHRKNPWVYMGFKTLTGKDAGICIIQDPEYTTEVTSWYIINDPATPFYYFSPAAIYDGKIILRKDDKLRLRNRVWILPGEINAQELDEKYNEYKTEKKL
jgi:type 1 glutamine amidotransferase